MADIVSGFEAVDDLYVKSVRPEQLTDEMLGLLASRKLSKLLVSPPFCGYERAINIAASDDGILEFIFSEEPSTHYRYFRVGTFEATAEFATKLAKVFILFFLSWNFRV